MQEQRGLRTLPRLCFVVAATALTTAALLDVGSVFGIISPPAAASTWVLVAVGIGAACAMVLLRVLYARAGLPRRTRLTAVEMVLIGLLLLAWWLRGHREVPPDPPLVAAQVVALAGLLGAAVRRRRAPDAGRLAAPTSHPHYAQGRLDHGHSGSRSAPAQD